MDSGHVTIRTDRNLPDKEFRYLRTVIVTAAVHQGFNHELRLRLTRSINLPAPGRRHTPRPLSLAECCVFSKQSQPPDIRPLPLESKSLHVMRRTLPVTVPFCLVPSPEFSQAP